MARTNLNADGTPVQVGGTTGIAAPKAPAAPQAPQAPGGGLYGDTSPAGTRTKGVDALKGAAQSPSDVLAQHYAAMTPAPVAQTTTAPAQTGIKVNAQSSANRGLSAGAPTQIPANGQAPAQGKRPATPGDYSAANAGMNPTQGQTRANLNAPVAPVPQTQAQTVAGPVITPAPGAGGQPTDPGNGGPTTSAPSFHVNQANGWEAGPTRYRSFDQAFGDNAGAANAEANRIQQKVATDAQDARGAMSQDIGDYLSGKTGQFGSSAGAETSAADELNALGQGAGGYGALGGGDAFSSALEAAAGQQGAKDTQSRYGGLDAAFATDKGLATDKASKDAAAAAAKPAADAAAKAASDANNASQNAAAEDALLQPDYQTYLQSDWGRDGGGRDAPMSYAEWKSHLGKQGG